MDNPSRKVFGRSRTPILAAAAVTVGAVGTLAPSAVAYASSTEAGAIYFNQVYPVALYNTDVFGSGTHISGMELEWSDNPDPGAWAGKTGFVEYARGSNGEPVGSALGGADFNMESYFVAPDSTYVGMNVTGINHDPYCDFIFVKGSNNSLVPLNEGPGKPACVTLSA